MLKEIICDKFKQQKITFHQGLNTILGDDIGSNSIGKSTFLLIIDFVFGGSSFFDATEVFKHLKHFEIKFKFNFEGADYYFIRRTEDSDTVYICNKSYEKVSKQTVAEFTKLLFDLYEITLPDISFRDIVGLYSRIYGKQNDNEKKPLTYVHAEKDETAINRLMKLFNLYSQIAEFANNKKEKEEKLKVYKRAQAYSMISKIGSRQYKQNQDKLEELNKKVEQLSTQISAGELDLKTEQLEELSVLKRQLSDYRKKRSRSEALLAKLEGNKASTLGLTSSDIEVLTTFFSGVNVKKINEINTFHSSLCKILSSEIMSQIKSAKDILEKINEHIEVITAKINTIVDAKNPSKLAIDKLLELKGEINSLNHENKSYENSQNYSSEKKNASELYEKLKGEQTTTLQQELNNKMSDINDYVYSNTKKSPVISFNSKSYNFSTPDDRGTGTSYKDMIVFDLSVLELTQLPILIHDSIILKQVADEAIDKIITKYSSFTSKQVFIALDKKQSYYQNTNNILTSTKVLELAPDGNELFGVSWNKKTK